MYIHSVAQNSTVGRKLWLWDYGYGGRGQHSLELSVLNYLAFYSESFYSTEYITYTVGMYSPGKAFVV